MKILRSHSLSAITPSLLSLQSGGAEIQVGASEARQHLALFDISPQCNKSTAVEGIATTKRNFFSDTTLTSVAATASAMIRGSETKPKIGFGVVSILVGKAIDDMLLSIGFTLARWPPCRITTQLSS